MPGSEGTKKTGKSGVPQSCWAWSAQCGRRRGLGGDFASHLLFCTCIWEDGGVFGKRHGLVRWELRNSADSQTLVV